MKAVEVLCLELDLDVASDVAAVVQAWVLAHGEDFFARKLSMEDTIRSRGPRGR